MWKRRRLETEEKSAADLSRRQNLCTVLAVVIHEVEADRAGVWRRNRLDWDKYLREMRHNHFRSMFRMSHACFLTILEQIGPFMERDRSQSEKAGGYISPSMQLGMSLRYLAGGLHLDMHDRYGVSKSSGVPKFVLPLSHSAYTIAAASHVGSLSDLKSRWVLLKQKVIAHKSHDGLRIGRAWKEGTGNKNGGMIWVTYGGSINRGG